MNAWWNTETVEIVISDDGPGIAPDMLKRIGEPYLSRRRSADEAQSEHHGLGLGVFIARTLLERTGAKVSFTNRTLSRSRRRGSDRVAARPLRGRRNRSRTSDLESPCDRYDALTSTLCGLGSAALRTPYG